MISALVLTAVVSTVPASDAPLHLGIDASEVTANLLGTQPRVDPSLLAFAPTSPGVAFAASAVSTGVGLFMIAGFTTLAALSSGLPLPLALAGAGLGFLLVDFGPNVGDLLNGDWGRFVRNGLLRIGAVLLSVVLGPYGVLLWLGWAALDVVNARYAPARWVERNLPAAAAPSHAAASAQALPVGATLVTLRF